MTSPDVSSDIARGDLGTAKRRLCSYIAGTRYSSAVCGRIGDICRKMKDPCEAGRWYFISDRPTAEVGEEIDAFVRMHNGRLGTILQQFPTHAKLSELGAYPEPVQQRLQSIGCVEGFGVSRAETVEGALANQGYAAGRYGQRWSLAGALIVGILLVLFVVFVIGLGTIVNWIR